jgi:hypothetical protein
MVATRIRMALDELKNTKLVKDDPRHKKGTNAVNPNTGFIPPASLPVRNLCTLEI